MASVLADDIHSYLLPPYKVMFFRAPATDSEMLGGTDELTEVLLNWSDVSDTGEHNRLISSCMAFSFASASCSEGRMMGDNTSTLPFGSNPPSPDRRVEVIPI